MITHYGTQADAVEQARAEATSSDACVQVAGAAEHRDLAAGEAVCEGAATDPDAVVIYHPTTPLTTGGLVCTECCEVWSAPAPRTRH